MSVSFLQPWALYLAAPLLMGALTLVLRKGSRFRSISAGLRSAVIVLFVLALSGPILGGSDPGIHTIYLIDVSDSVSPEARDRAADFVAESVAGLEAPDTAGVMVFGSTSRVVATPDSRTARVVGRLRSVAEDLRQDGLGEASDPAGALEHAGTELPESGDRRIVLISDGIETTGNARAAAAQLQERGVRVATVYVDDPAAEETRIAELRTPRQVEPGTVYEITVVTQSSSPGAGRLTLYRDGSSLGSEEVELSRGRNVFRYRDQAETSGIVSYRAVLEPSADVHPENNSAGAATRVGVGGRILYLREGDETRPMEAALRTQDLEVVGRTPAELTATLTELSAFEAVVLDNVPAARFSLSRMNELERYVRQTGGGVVMLGGPSSFGAGGYFRTPVEQLMPVSMDVTSTVRVPTLAMLFVVDKSGSMEASPGTAVAKLDVVKEAVLSSVEIMNPYHLVGLVSFDAGVERTVPLTRVARQNRIAGDVARLRSGGGTVLASAMEEAREVLQPVEATTKHVIILSDGLSRDADFRALSRQLAGDGISVSAVSIGQDANKRLMEMIAQEGGGRYYHTDDTSGVPRIFTRETSIVARNVVVEETFFPSATSRHPLLAGLSGDELPALEGFVMTYPKSSARQLMDASQGHPLLATWQYGLGRAAAFTSSIDGRWGGAWASWELLPRFAGQLLEWVKRPADLGDVDVSVERRGNRSFIRVDVTENGTRYVDGAQMTASLARPDGSDQRVSLEQVGPGRYVGTVDPADTGIHVLTVMGSQDDADGADRIGPAVVPVVVPYAREYAELQPNPTALREIAMIGDGPSVSLASGSFPHGDMPRVESAGTEPRSIWPLLLVLATILLTVEIVLHILRSRGVPAGSRGRSAGSRAGSRAES